jgi:PsbP
MVTADMAPVRKLGFLLACFTATDIYFSLALSIKQSIRTHGSLPIISCGASANFIGNKMDIRNASIARVIDYEKDSATLRQRRDFCYLLSCIAFGVLQPCQASFASPVEEGSTFRRETEGFRYEFQPPPGFVGPGQKPLKTHLDEVNFQSSEIPGYQIGITVDPVRISTLTEFGTAEQVAAKVLLAEVNRDGVLDVKLLEDPVSDEIQVDGGARTIFYQLNYLSSGKRGNKRNIAKFYVQNQKLFALTAQCKEESYEMARGTMLAAVRSFRVL